MSGLTASNIWHSHWFTIRAPPAHRKYMVNILQIGAIIDVVDRDTGAPFTADEWEKWIIRLHMDYMCEIPSDATVQKWVNTVMGVEPNPE